MIDPLHRKRLDTLIAIRRDFNDARNDLQRQKIPRADATKMRLVFFEAIDALDAAIRIMQQHEEVLH
jgi:hypothetical protein